MDRSFLSQPEVVAASRRLVCVRLTTYENKEEGAFLKAFDVTRSGELENTVFTILSPDGKRQLARAARSARRTFGDARELADTMNRLARAYPAKASAAAGVPELPRVANVRLAVNVAACDSRPLVVLFGKDARVRQELEERLRPLAWGVRFLGRFVYVVSAEAGELARIEGERAEAGVLVVQPDRFGLKGKVLSQVGAAGTREQLVQCLEQGAALHRSAEKSFRNHVREGQRQGVFWETVIPVTDPMEQRARERGRRQRSETK
jgi:hypothetical protein